MTFDSSNDTVAILYDIENAPYEMLDYTLGQARRFQPCRIIVVTDWDKVPEDQKRWERLRRRPGFTFRPVTRTYLGKNSLDNALYDSALVLYQDGVRRFFIITTDSDFVKIAEALNSGEKSYIIGVGTKQASETLRSAYDEFLCYPPEKPEKKPRKAKTEKSLNEEKKDADVKSSKKTEKTKKKTKSAKATEDVKATQASKKAQQKPELPKQKNAEPKKEAAAKKNVDTKNVSSKTVKAQKAAESSKKEPSKKELSKKEPSKNEPLKKEPPTSADSLTIRLPRTLQRDLERRKAEEGVSMDELVTYLIMRGLA